MVRGIDAFGRGVDRQVLGFNLGEQRETTAEIAYELADQLEDWVCETSFATPRTPRIRNPPSPLSGVEPENRLRWTPAEQPG